MQNIDIHSSRQAATNQTQGGCACGGHDDELPEIDAQTIPHAVRHAALFGAIDSLRPGGALVISATHDPVPLLNQLQQRSGDEFNTRYLQAGPDRWRILIRRAG